MPLKRFNFEQYISSLIQRKEMPGLSILVARRNDLLFEGCFGHRALLPQRERLTPETIYDLASLTKPLVTAFLAVYLFSRSHIGLHDEVRKYCPSLKFAFTPAQMLTHTSGFLDWYPFYLYRPSGPMNLDEFLPVALKYKPGKRVLYSCVGYMFLHRLLEKVAGMPLEKLAGEVLFGPLKLKNCFLSLPRERIQQTAPTEKGNVHEKRMGLRFDRPASLHYPWRTEIIRGQTHDVNSFHQGGFAGNAGLFADARDVWRLSLEFFPETATILESRFLGFFWKNLTPGFRTHRSVGFKLNSSLITSGGRALESTAIGHNGFTGTSLWLEKRSGLIWILLSNRIHPHVPSGSFDPVRRRLHRLLKSALLLQ